MRTRLGIEDWIARGIGGIHRGSAFRVIPIDRLLRMCRRRRTDQAQRSKGEGHTAQEVRGHVQIRIRVENRLREADRPMQER